jgi:hypothetical protein
MVRGVPDLRSQPLNLEITLGKDLPQLGLRLGTQSRGRRGFGLLRLQIFVRKLKLPPQPGQLFDQAPGTLASGFLGLL